MQELARCLWGLATMNVKVVKALRILQKEVEARLPEMNAVDLAQIAWAFGTLKHHPGALLDLLANAAVQQLDQFEPQVSRLCSRLATADNPSLNCSWISCSRSYNVPMLLQPKVSPCVFIYL